MPKAKSRTRRPPKRILALPDLQHAETAVLTVKSRDSCISFVGGSRDEETTGNPSAYAPRGRGPDARHSLRCIPLAQQPR
jgi:hypothetical protein